MSLHVLKNIPQHKSSKLVNLLYSNFRELEKEKELMHNKDELTRLVTGKNTILLLIMVNKKIASYLIGEVKDLNDGRKVFYISYLYTAAQFRKKGHATRLLKYVERMVRNERYNGILLTCDTQDNHIVHFYKKNGFSLDPTLRRNEKHDIFYKIIS